MASNVSDDAFAQALSQTGVVSDEHIDAARTAQIAAKKQGVSLSLADTMLLKGLLTPAIRESIEKKLLAQGLEQTQPQLVATQAFAPATQVIESQPQPVIVPAQPAKAGSAKTLGSYKLLKKLGEGAMGTVLLAEDSSMGRQVALKVLPKKLAENKEFLARFKREAQATGRLNHVNIVAAYNVGEDQGHHFYAMEYCVGETLDKILKRDGSVSWDTAVSIMIQVASGLRHAHEHGVIHRDIKPGNIFICRNPLNAPIAASTDPFAEGFVAKILDLGLSKSIDGNEASYFTQAGVTVGTPHYISPEQSRGDAKIDGRTDIYSLGATFFHLVTGTTPFDGASVTAVMLSHQTKPLPNPQVIRPDLPDGVTAIIQKMTAKETADRYRNCQELIIDLESVLQGNMPPVACAEDAASPVAKKRTGGNQGIADGRTSVRRAGTATAAPADAGRARSQRAEAVPVRAKGKKDGEAAPAASNNTKRNIVIGGLGAVVLILLVAVAMRGGKNPSPNETGKDAKTAEVKTPAKVEPKVDPDVEPTEPGARKRWLFDQFNKFQRANPDAFAESMQKLDALEKLYEKDDTWVELIQNGVKALKQRAEKRADELAEACGAAAMKKAESGDFNAALAELGKFPDTLTRTEASSRILFYKRKLYDKAMSQYQTADNKAQQLAKESNYDAALKAYDTIASFGYPQLDKLITVRRNEIKDIVTRGLNPSEGKTPPQLAGHQAYYAADIYVGLPNVVPVFDTACQEGSLGTRESAKGKIDLAQYPRSAVLHYAQAMLSARQGSTEEATFHAAQASRLAVMNDAFKSRLLCVEGRIAFAGIDLNGAVRKAQEALQLDSKNADAHFLVASVHFWAAETFPPDNPTRKAYVKNGYEALRSAARLDPKFAKLAPDVASEPEQAPDQYQYAGTGGNPYLASVVRVFGFTAFGQGHGTGWAVKSTPKTAYIITNNHVIKDLTEITVTYQFEAFGNLVRKESKQVKVLATDAVNDLALLEVQTEKEIKPLPLRPTTSGLTIPMKLTLIGHPKELDFTVMSGELANLNRIVDGKRHLQTNANVDSGMSGGPVIDDQGYVIGVTVAKYEKIQGQNLAILSEHVRDICTKGGITVELKQPGAAPPAPPAPPK